MRSKRLHHFVGRTQSTPLIHFPHANSSYDTNGCSTVQFSDQISFDTINTWRNITIAVSWYDLLTHAQTVAARDITRARWQHQL